MKDGIYPNGNWKPLPEDESAYRSKKRPLRTLIWWTLAMGAFMGAMAIAGMLFRGPKDD